MALSAVALLVTCFTTASPMNNAIAESTTSVTVANGTTYTATNHLLPEAHGKGREWLIAWAGSADSTKPDFMAIIDATRNSPSYGKVVNTVTFGPGLANEAHHMQYVWHKGDRIYAGGLFSDTVYVLDAQALPKLKLVGVTAPDDTRCGTAPDAFQVLRDGTAYGTFLGSGAVPGPCTYTNGEVRTGNGAVGSPGEVVRFDRNGKVLAEIPAATAEGEDPVQCANNPVLEKATCANPHGIMVNERRNIMVATDFLEGSHWGSPDVDLREDLTRQTVRVWDIKNRNNPKLLSVSKVHDGPRTALESDPIWGESRVIMEPALPNKAENKGVFVSSMTGGAIFYSPDITAKKPQWREVFDDTTAYRKAGTDLTGGGDNGSWLMVSPDDRFLFHAVMGYPKAYGKPLDKTRGMIFVLDIRKLLAAGDDPKCDVDKLTEVYAGGSETDCPAVAGVEMIRDTTDGGSHWGAMDNFARTPWGAYRETTQVGRIATANYFIAGAFGGDGNHKVCMHNLTPSGAVSLDTTFRDEVNGQPCVDFNRTSWPHGDSGGARPHGILFAVSDSVLQ